MSIELTSIIRSTPQSRVESEFIKYIDTHNKWMTDSLKRDDKYRTIMHHLADLSHDTEYNVVLQTLLLNDVAREAMFMSDDEGNTPLHIAVSAVANSFTCYSNMIRTGHAKVQLLAKNDLGNTPLHIAVMHDHLKMVDDMCVRCMYDGPDTFDEVVGVVNGKNLTAVHYAVGNPQILDLLLGYITDANVMKRIFSLRNSEGNTVLHTAFIGECTKSAELLVHHFCKLCEHPRKEYACLWTSLTGKASYTINLATMKRPSMRALVLKRLFHHISNDSDTAMDFLSVCLNIMPTRYIIEYVDAKTDSTPFHYAAGRYSSDVLDILITKLRERITKYNIWRLFEKDTQGRTPLHIAAEYCNIQCVKSILKSTEGYCDLSKDKRECTTVLDKRGNTPLLTCLTADGNNTNCNRGGCAKLLMSRGYGVYTIANNAGDMPSTYITDEGKLLEHFSKKCADTDDSPGECDTQEKYITIKKSSEESSAVEPAGYILTPIEQLYLSGKADGCTPEQIHNSIVKQDSSGNTILHRAIAAGSRSIDMIRAIFHYAASSTDFGIKNNDGETPLEILVRTRDCHKPDFYEKCTALFTKRSVVYNIASLIELYCKYNDHTSLSNLLKLSQYRIYCLISDTDGNTPMHISVMHSSVECVKTLLNYNGGKASLLRKNNKGQVPCMLADNNEIVTLILNTANGVKSVGI